MSLNRYAPKRDKSEPTIRARFSQHGWHTEALSGKGLPDLLCMKADAHAYIPGARWEPRYLLVDVKEPKGKPTPAQVEKWKALSTKGIPVYVARTEADVDAIVAGSAEPWGVMEAKPKRGTVSKGMGHAIRDQDPEWLKARALKAAREAEETFAPGPEEGSEAHARGERVAPGACPYPTCAGDCEHGKL